MGNNSRMLKSRLLTGTAKNRAMTRKHYKPHGPSSTIKPKLTVTKPITAHPLYHTEINFWFPPREADIVYSFYSQPAVAYQLYEELVCRGGNKADEFKAVVKRLRFFSNTADRKALQSFTHSAFIVISNNISLNRACDSTRDAELDYKSDTTVLST